MRVQVREGGTGKAGGTRACSNSSSSSSNNNNYNRSSSSNGRSNLSTVVAGVELHWLAPSIVGMPRQAGTFGMTQVPCRQVGRSRDGGGGGGEDGGVLYHMPGRSRGSGVRGGGAVDGGGVAALTVAKGSPPPQAPTL